MTFKLLGPTGRAPRSKMSPFLFHIRVPGVLSLLTRQGASTFIPNVGSLLGNKCPLGSNAITLSTRRGVRGKGATVDTFTTCHTTGTTNGRTSTRITTGILGSGMTCFNCNCVGSIGRLIPGIPLAFCVFHIVIVLNKCFVLFFVIILFLTCGGSLSQVP